MDRYFDDFICRKLHLEALGSTRSPLTSQLLRSYTGDLKAGETNDVLGHLAELHIRVHVRKLNLTRVTTILKPFSMVQFEMKDQLTPDCPKEALLGSQHEAPVGIIVDHIFQYVKRASGKPPGERTHQLNLFYKRYNDLVSQFIRVCIHTHWTYKFVITFSCLPIPK